MVVWIPPEECVVGATADCVDGGKYGHQYNKPELPWKFFSMDGIYDLVTKVFLLMIR